MEVKRIKKFEKMVLRVDLSSEAQIFFAICKEFGDCFTSLFYNEEQWENIRRFVLGDEKLLPLIQQVLKDKHSLGLKCDSAFDVEIEVKRNTLIRFNHIFKHKKFIIYPDFNKKRRMSINTMVSVEGKVRPEVIVVVNYSKSPSLKDWERYLNLSKKLEDTKGFRGLERLIYQEEDIFEEEENERH